MLFSRGRVTLIVAVVLASMFVMLNWRKAANYDSIYFQEARSSVGGKLGRYIASYDCKAEERTMIDQVDALCQQEGVVQVVEFQPCYIQALCRGKVWVAFNGDDQMLYKARSSK